MSVLISGIEISHPSRVSKFFFVTSRTSFFFSFLMKYTLRVSRNKIISNTRLVVGLTASAGNCTPACYLLKPLSGPSVQPGSSSPASDSETGIFEARDKSTVWPEMNEGLAAFSPSFCLGAWRRRRRRKETGCDWRSRTARCYGHSCRWADLGACVSANGRLLSAAGRAPAGRTGSEALQALLRAAGPCWYCLGKVTALRPRCSAFSSCPSRRQLRQRASRAPGKAAGPGRPGRHSGGGGGRAARGCPAESHATASGDDW